MAKSNRGQLPELVFPKRDMSLTPREQEILQRFAYGKTYREIAEELEISPATIGTYLQRVREKIRAKNRADLIRFAMKEGMLKDAQEPKSKMKKKVKR